MAVTQVATAAAALAWMFCEWKVHGKPSALGIASGAVAGLVAITLTGLWLCWAHGCIGNRHSVGHRLLLGIF